MGRPKSENTADMAVINFKIESNLKLEFTKLCKSRGLGLSGYMRMMMINELENEENKRKNL